MARIAAELCSRLALDLSIKSKMDLSYTEISRIYLELEYTPCEGVNKSHTRLGCIPRLSLQRMYKPVERKTQGKDCGDRGKDWSEG